MPTELDMLRARLRLSHARMYLRDLEQGADFGRMVDSRGSNFNCSPAIWIGFIQKICAECCPFIPDQVGTVLARLEPYAPRLPITGG